jgi:hypothetical protein
VLAQFPTLFGHLIFIPSQLGVETRDQRIAGRRRATSDF